jgi:gas vesicle protein
MISWLIGFSLGAALGAAIIMLLLPASGQNLTSTVKSHYQRALDAGKSASDAKRAAMEEEWQQMRKARGLAPKAP